MMSELEGYRWDAILLSETRGDTNRLNYVRHITITFSWDLENSTQNTVLEFC